jgi:O-antigen/teichoic acid export membrane protein
MGIWGSWLAGSIVGAAVALTAPFLVPWLLGDEFSSAVPMIWIMLPGVVLFGALQTIGPYFNNNLKRPAAYTVSVVVMVATDVILLLILAGRYGGIGASIASAAAYALGTGFAILAIVRFGSASLADILVIRGSDIRTLRGAVGRMSPRQ